MRDVVSEVGTFYTGLGALPVLKTTQTSAWIDTQAFDGLMVYILSGNWTDGTFTPVLHVSDDGSTDLGAAPVADLILWTATSTTVFTPVKVGNSQPSAISSAATAINQRIGYIGLRRYVQMVSTISGSPSTGMGYDVIIMAGRPRIMPSAV